MGVSPVIWRGAEGLRVAGFASAFFAAGLVSGLAGVETVFAGAVCSEAGLASDTALGDALAAAGFETAALAGAALPAFGLALAGRAFDFADAALAVAFAGFGAFSGWLSVAITKPSRTELLFADAAIMPIPALDFKLFLCGAQIFLIARG
jgi:hypothetical protein